MVGLYQRVFFAPNQTHCAVQSTGMRLWLAGRLSRLLPAGWLLLRNGTVPDETLVATDGRVRLRQTSSGVIALTAVKGTSGSARETGIGRLEAYAAGQNLTGLSVTTAGPLVQRPTTSGRWLVEIRLPGLADPLAAPFPRNRKIRIQSAPAETLATIRLPGYLSRHGIARAEEEILTVMAARDWHAAGPAMLRLLTPLALFPLLGSFEIAVPVDIARR